MLFFMGLLCYDRNMEWIQYVLSLTSHCLFIGLVYRLLDELFDWDKLIKDSDHNKDKLRLFVLLVSIGLGYVVSQFVLGLIQMGQYLGQLV